MDIQYIGGADPEMVFLDKDYTEVEVCFGKGGGRMVSLSLSETSLPVFLEFA